MEYAFLFFAGICISVITYAQDKRFDSLPDKLKVTLSKNDISVYYKNQPVSIRSVQALDSLMKNIPCKEHLNIEFASVNADAEKIKSINAVLKQCNCPITRIKINSND
jgi:uncharacterized protein (UPF0276 family)